MCCGASVAYRAIVILVNLELQPRCICYVLCLMQRQSLSHLMIVQWSGQFFGLLLVSEFCPPSASKFSKDIHLSVEDVDVNLSAGYVAVSLKQSKSDPFRLGVTIRIGSLNHRLCPVRAMAAYLLARGSAPGPLFVFRSGAVFTRVFLVNMLRKWFPTVGTINSHSFRRGGATALAASGASDFTIQLLGRWKSYSYLRYIDITDSTFTNPFHRVMGNEVED